MTTSVAAIAATELRPGMPQEPALPLSVSQYHEMARAGILMSGDPIELLEGWLVRKMTKNPAHVISTSETRDALDRLAPDGWFVSAQEPITTADSEPEPDVAVIRGRLRDYTDRHPEPADIGLVVEVADSSLARDRTWKKRVYAAAGISNYWIVNLIDECVEVFTDPTGAGESTSYDSCTVYQRNSAVPVAIAGISVGHIDVNDVLP